jgi:hypothetical protein
LEHGNSNRKIADTETGDESAHSNMDPTVRRRNLNDISCEEDSYTQRDTLSSAKPVRGTMQALIINYRPRNETASLLCA